MVSDIQEEKSQNALESLPGVDLRDITEQLVSLSRGAGAAVISIADDFTPLHGVYCLEEHQATATQSIDLQVVRRAPPQSDFLDVPVLHIDGTDYEKKYALLAHQLSDADGECVGCVIVFVLR